MNNLSIEIKDHRTILTYRISSLASLTAALQQVSDFLRNHGSGENFLTLKSGTVIKVSQSHGPEQNSRLQFNIPVELSRIELADFK